jgi:hypothetical protein
MKKRIKLLLVNIKQQLEVSFILNMIFVSNENRKEKQKYNRDLKFQKAKQVVSKLIRTIIKNKIFCY